MTKKTATTKTATILERKELHRLGMVAYKVQSSDGARTYTTTVKRNGEVKHCNCTGFAHAQHCYHASTAARNETLLREEQRAWMGYHEMTA